ncbi:hypothetical protein [Kineococcus sp. SYSU DK003]|uniref:hypothetical protein n=1 Tax=Kineococcus sp. SYSU DK003 TaxID=3383124 RepID=UPI003D7E12E7
MLGELARECVSDVAPRHPAALRLSQEAVTSPLPLDELARARLDVAAEHLLSGAGVSTAARRAGSATRAGLLRALSRETGLSTREIALDPPGALPRP